MTSLEIFYSQITRIVPHSLPESVTRSCLCILSHSLSFAFFVWLSVGTYLILSDDSLARSVFLTISVFKEFVILIFMQVIWENILCTFAEECVENATLFMTGDNKVNQSYPILNHRYAVKFSKTQIFGRKKQKRILGTKPPDLGFSMPFSIVLSFVTIVCNVQVPFYCS